MIRIASYNIRKAVGLDWRRRPERILDVLAETGADVAVLQEADRRFGGRNSALPAALLAKAGWQPVALAHRAGSIGWHGNAVLMRDGLAAAQARPVWLPGLEPRGAVIVDLAAGMRIAGVHLGLTPGWRRRQIGQVLEELDRLDAMPTLIAGDFNEWPSTNVNLEALSRAYSIVAPGPSFHAARPMAELDLFAAGGGLNVTGSGVHSTPLSRLASDHLPVWIDVDL